MMARRMSDQTLDILSGFLVGMGIGLWLGYYII